VLGTIITLWAAAYGIAGIHYLLDYARRRERADLTFGLLAVAFAAYSVGSSILVEATDAHQTMVGSAIKLGAGFIGVAVLNELCCTLGTGVHPTARPFVNAVSSFALVALAAGWVLSDEAPRAEALVHLVGPDYHEPRVTAVGVTLLVAAWLGIAHSALRFIGSRDPGTKRKLVRIACGLTLAAAAHDTTVFLGWVESYYLLEHVGLLFLIAMSSVLVERAWLVHQELSTRQRALVQSDELLREASKHHSADTPELVVGELSGIIAGELLEPLTTVREAAGTLRVEKKLETLDQLDNSINHLSRLVDDLLAYTRPLSLQRQDVSLRTIIERAARALETLGPDGEAGRIHVDLEQQTARTISADSRLLERTLEDLLRELSRSWQSHRLKVRVDETSGGVATEVRPEEPKEVTPHSPRTESRGTLSRAIFDRVVRVHGGSLIAEPDRILFTLPTGEQGHVAE
jgi:signal transduction histidine kinase